MTRRCKKAMLIYSGICAVILISLLIVNYFSFAKIPENGNYPGIFTRRFESGAEGVYTFGETREVNSVSSGNFVLTNYECDEKKFNTETDTSYYEKVYTDGLHYVDEKGYTESLYHWFPGLFRPWNPRLLIMGDESPINIKITTAYVGGEYVCSVSVIEAPIEEVEWKVSDSIGSAFVSNVHENGDHSSALFITTMKEMPDKYTVYLNDLTATFSKKDRIEAFQVLNYFRIMIAFVILLVGLGVVFLIFNRKKKLKPKNRKDVFFDA